MNILDLAHNAIGLELKFNFGKCLRNFKFSKCRSCLSACPHDALILKNNKIRLFYDKCTYCGICLSICPAEAFTTKPSLADLVIKKLKKNKLSVLACQHSHQKNCITVNCLASLHEAILITAVLKTGSSILVVDKCSECSIGPKAIPLVKKKVRMANSLLKTLSNTLKVKVLEKPVFLEEHISREKFFQQIGNELLNLGLGSILSKQEIRDNDLPQNRQLFNKLLENKILPQTMQVSLPFFQLRIAESCDFCLKCAQICPTQAIYIENIHPHSNPPPVPIGRQASRGKRIAPKLSLKFSMKNCTGCNLCVEVCPSSSIVLTNKADLSLLNKTIDLKETDLKQCQTCGQNFTGSQKLCKQCHKKEDLNTQMASLFQ